MYNQQPPNNTSQRRYIVAANSLTSNTLHFRNPWIAAWWSASFPGFGQFFVGSYLFSFILMTVEFILNGYTHINTYIFYTMTGEFEKAKEILNLKFFLVYIMIYVFGIWNAYRRAVDINKVYQLAYREMSIIHPFQFSPMEINTLEKKIPIIAMFWSFFMPGLGAIYFIDYLLFFFLFFGGLSCFTFLMFL